MSTLGKITMQTNPVKPDKMIDGCFLVISFSPMCLLEPGPRRFSIRWLYFLFLTGKLDAIRGVAPLV